MKRKIIVNRWFRANGQKKRVDLLFDNFWNDAELLKDSMINFDSIKIVTYIRQKYNVSLADALDMMVAFIGYYDNDKQSNLFKQSRYDNGITLWGKQLGKQEISVGITGLD